MKTEIINHSGWIWIKNINSNENRDKITGKYLFFSDDKEELIGLAKNILTKYNLLIAKTPKTDIPNRSKGFGFVLCIYDVKNRYSNELKSFASKSISYRYWKSDQATRNKVYSKQYINTQ